MGQNFLSRQLADARWLHDARAGGYCRLLGILLPLLAIGWVLVSSNGIDLRGEPLGTDFLSFWTASALALSGHPADTYMPALHHTAQISAMGFDPGYFAFFYPPPYLLLCLPLALLPYTLSLAAWVGVTGYAYIRAITLWLGAPRAWMMAFAFPATLVNAGHGQNGFLTAALGGSGLALLERRPWFAGFLLGGLVIKPHLALLIPVALALRGCWRAFFATGIGAALWMALSLAVFGMDAWSGFLSDSALARATLEQGLVDPAKMQSVFASVRVLGGSLTIAYAAQAVMTLTIIAALTFFAHRRASPAAQNAMLALGAVIATPFVFDYDLTWLAFPLVWMIAEGRKAGFLTWEKTGMAIAFLLPLFGRSLALSLHMPIAPFVLSLLFGLLIRRTIHSAPARAFHPNPLLPRTGTNG